MNRGRGCSNPTPQRKTVRLVENVNQLEVPANTISCWPRKRSGLIIVGFSEQLHFRSPRHCALGWPAKSGPSDVEHAVDRTAFRYTVDENDDPSDILFERKPVNLHRANRKPQPSWIQFCTHAVLILQTKEGSDHLDTIRLSLVL